MDLRLIVIGALCAVAAGESATAASTEPSEAYKPNWQKIIDSIKSAIKEERLPSVSSDELKKFTDYTKNVIKEMYANLPGNQQCLYRAEHRLYDLFRMIARYVERCTNSSEMTTTTEYATDDPLRDLGVDAFDLLRPETRIWLKCTSKELYTRRSAIVTIIDEFQSCF